MPGMSTSLTFMFSGKSMSKFGLSMSNFLLPMSKFGLSMSNFLSSKSKSGFSVPETGFF